jgi:uncharacterized protein HemX
VTIKFNNLKANLNFYAPKIEKQWVDYFIGTKNIPILVKRETESLRHLEDQLKKAQKSLETETKKLEEYQESMEQLSSDLETKKAAVEGEF